jgi:signal transduction histidine kinase
VGADLVEGCVAVVLSDTGPGLPERARATLFQAFMGSSREGGAGLGLAIARDLARAQGGDLALTSSSEEGAVFTLTLPAAPALAGGAAPLQRAAVGPARG